MAKRSYKTVPISRLNIERLREQVGSRCIFGVDIAKTRQVGAFSGMDGRAVVRVHWNHPSETRELLDTLERMRVTGIQVEVAMEPTGSYSTSLLHCFTQAKLPVYRVQGKSTKDGRELFDGVASSHDPKAAAILCWLHSDGLGRLWTMKTEHEQDLRAATAEVARHTDTFQRLTSKVEALLAKHWPELCELNMHRLMMPLRMLAKYGSPEQFSKNLVQVAAQFRANGPRTNPAKLAVILTTCRSTLGAPMTKVSQMVMQHVAQEAVETFQRLRAARKMLEELVGEDAPETLTKLIGTATTGLLIGLGLDPRKSASPAAFVKGLGLNLTIDQSGSSKRGRERISKRGHGLARKWLYLATMRLTQNEPIAKAWYQKARRRMAGCSCVKPMVALMRKLAKGIWHVARGAEFDAEKLFNIKRLEGFLTK